MALWLRLCTPDAGAPGSIPGQGTRSRMPQLKIPHTTTKDPTYCNKDPSQPNKETLKKEDGSSSLTHRRGVCNYDSN